MAQEKRKRIRNGERARPEDKIHVGASAPGGFSLMSTLNVMGSMDLLDHLEFAAK